MEINRKGLYNLLKMAISTLFCLSIYLLFIFLKGLPMSKESTFQHNLIKNIENMFPGCIVLKNDANYIQGFPDLLILYQDKWAALECKRSSSASHQPNQEYYVDVLNEMSYARFIFPENKDEILNELQQAFRPRRSTRVSKRKQVPLD